MQTEFTSEFFARNRRQLRQLFTGTAPIVVTANGQLQRSGDTTFPFTQDANFWYLTGIDEPDVVLVMDKDKEYLIVPFREGVRVAFDGAIDVSGLARTSGIANILDEKEGWGLLESRIVRVKHVATIKPLPRYIDTYGMYTNPSRKRLLGRLKQCNAEIELLDLSEHMAHMRMIKQAPELAAIRQAIAITGASLKDATRKPKRLRYAYEYELEAEIARGFRRCGASGHAFDPIVASGKNATTIHYLANNAPLSADELVVLDVGAEHDHYAADITRTIALKQPSRRQQQVFDAVKAVQAYAFNLVKPGVTLGDIEKQVEHKMGEKLRELGLIQSIERDVVRRYYPHAVSHHLGLNVHDVADHSRPLEPGMVITVEPGVYIPEESIGVRIEDDVLITEAGNEILSAGLPAKLY